MSDKYLSFSEMAEVEALKVHELCTGAVDPECDDSQNLDVEARETIFHLAKQGRFKTLNKAGRSLESHRDASVFFEICEGEAISTSVQEANGKKYLCTTMFIPISFSLSPLNQDQAVREMAVIKPVLPNEATRGIKSALSKHFNQDFEVLPFLMDEYEICQPSNKESVKTLSQLYGTYALSKGLGNPSGHDERFIEFLSDNFDIETSFDFSNGTFDIIKLVMVSCFEEITNFTTNETQSLKWGLPLKLLSNSTGDALKLERSFIMDATNTIQTEYNKVEEVDIYVSAGSPQHYTMLDLGHVVTTAGTVVKHMSTILSEVAHCDLMVEVDRASAEIALSYKFKRSLDEFDEDNMAIRIPYMPFRPNNPLTEIELQQSYIQNIVGIGCSLSVES